MLGYSQPRVLSSPFEGLKRDDTLSETSEKFKSALIVAYEEALEHGLTPASALAAILDLVSVELKRTARASPRET